MNYFLVVLDTNKLLAAALKPGRVRTLLYQAPITPIAPPYILEEVEEHAEELGRRAGMTGEQFLFLVKTVLHDRVREVVPIEPFVSMARGLARGFDPDDWPFIALAAQYGAPIWTNDRELIRHSLKTKKYKAIDTEGLETLLEGKSLEEVLERMKKKYWEG